MNDKVTLAPELQVTQWFNSKQPLTLAGLRGRVVVLHAFQMLCPGCVQHGIPQAQRIFEQFARDDVVVIGLHTVFEHHDVMTPSALAVFIHEYRLRFPVGVDAPDGSNAIPLTMRVYDMEGTPTVVVIDRQGRVRLQEFGHVPDLHLGVAIGKLLVDPTRPSVELDEIQGNATSRERGSCGT